MGSMGDKDISDFYYKNSFSFFIFNCFFYLLFHMPYVYMLIAMSVIKRLRYQVYFRACSCKHTAKFNLYDASDCGH